MPIGKNYHHIQTTDKNSQKEISSQNRSFSQDRQSKNKKFLHLIRNSNSVSKINVNSQVKVLNV
jgi:hypothetical protein